MVESGRGGTHQARFERDVIQESVRNRLTSIEIGDQSLVFGRIDQGEDIGGDTFHIGRVAVWNDDHDPVVVDWRAPVAEPFYRATGVEPLGLVRRRHFATRGRELLGIEDEYFGDGIDGAGSDSAVNASSTTNLKGEQTLIATLESARTGRLGDIVGTIQGEQDEIIRSPLPGILIAQGGPGTGKTVVALHRAAYLLYTHRFPLAGQGVLVIGPNRLFLTYIEQVLPSLGESGVELVVLGDLIPGARVQGSDALTVARTKGDLRIVDLIWKAVRDRQRPLREDLVLPVGLERLRITVEQSRDIIATVRRKARTHNHGRKFVVQEVFNTLAASSRHDADPDELKEQLIGTQALRETLEWMWPVLTPPQLLHDLYGSRALLRSAGRKLFTDAELMGMYRERTHHSSVLWTQQDVPVLDEARAHLGARPGRKVLEEVRTYGHIVLDEAQDMSPMQLRMVSRRSLNGSMTIVGDIAQATSAWAHEDWDSLLEHLPDRPARLVELTVGYRLPAPTMELAARVLKQAAPELRPPVAVRRDGASPRFVSSSAGSLGASVVNVIAEERAALGTGNIAVIATASMVPELSDALTAAGITHGLTYSGALERDVSIIAVSVVKGLEIDAAIVVEPQRILDEEPQPLKSLYVSVTRATRRLTIVHEEPLPELLQ